MFYRDRNVGVAWEGVALSAVTIEPFEVSLRRGGCGGLWDFNQSGLAVEVAARGLRGCAVALGSGWNGGLRVSAWCVGGRQGLEAVEKTSYGVACGNTQERDDRAGEAIVHGAAVLGAGSGAVERTRRLEHGDQRIAQILGRDALNHHHGGGADGARWLVVSSHGRRMEVWLCAEQRAAALERSGTAAVGEQAEVADAYQAPG